jgi:hypothetical protein
MNLQVPSPVVLIVLPGVCLLLFFFFFFCGVFVFLPMNDDNVREKRSEEHGG